MTPLNILYFLLRFLDLLQFQESRLLDSWSLSKKKSNLLGKVIQCWFFNKKMYVDRYNM